MAEPAPVDDDTDMELLDAVKTILTLMMDATQKLTDLALVLISRRRRHLRDQRPLPPE